MESYEQKYKEALERAREELQKCGSLDCDCAKQMFRMFPELKESEDERVRKAILELVRQSSEVLDKQNQNNMIAWLEKQGQEPRKVSIWEHWKDGICGNGEGKLIYLIKEGGDYSLSSGLGHECDYILLSDLDNLMIERQETSYTKRNVDDAYVEGMVLAKNELEKQGEQKLQIENLPSEMKTIGESLGFTTQEECDEYNKMVSDLIMSDNDKGEQKPAEWSKEDEKCIRLSTDIIDSALRAGFCVQLDRDRCVDWFNSIKDRLQPQTKQEWSEEDENICCTIINDITNDKSMCKYEISKGICDVQINWLNSLKKRYTWTPSDEQIDALADALSLAKSCGEERAFDLRTLLEQLKKLKGH